MRVFKFAGAAVVAVIVVAGLLLVIGIPSGFLTSAIQDRVEKQTGYQLTIDGSTKISLWPTLNVSLGDVTLQDPKDRDGSSRITVENVQADVALGSVWSGHPHVSELIVTKPVLYRPLLRERTADGSSRSTKSATEPDLVDIDRVKIIDGAIVASNPRDRTERRIEGITGEAVIGSGRTLKFSGNARTEGNPLSFDITATLASDRQPIPMQLTLNAPGLLSSQLSARADVRFNGPVATINNLSGSLGGGAFNGGASVDLGSKPLVKVDLDFQRLDLNSKKPTTTSAPVYGWSEAPLNLAILNYVDAQVRISAAELDIAGAQLAPARIDASLAAGVMKASFSNLGAYGGQAGGEIIIDASSGNPTYAMHTDIMGVRALPLLTSLADFDSLDGKMQAKIAVRSAGGSQQAIMSNLSGTAFVTFQDGAIRGINVAQMIRSLTSSTLNGWQEQQQQGTDLTQLSSSFKIDRGQAVTTDLNLVGPLVRVTGAGTVDLGTKMMGFRVEPKLVMTTQGQGRTNDPVGFGVPVMIQGPWWQPKIFPDMQGIMDDPNAAYAKLRQMGQGLFGPNGGGLDGLIGGLSALTNNNGANNGSVNNGGNPGNTAGNGQPSNDPLGGALGGNLGQALNNFLQNGLGGQGQAQGQGIARQGSPAQGQGYPGQSRSIPMQDGAGQNQATQSPSAPDQAGKQSPPIPPEQSPQSEAQDSQPMNDVMRQLFNR